PRAESFQIGADQLGIILKDSNDVYARLSVRTPFVDGRGYLIFRAGSKQVVETGEVNGLIGKARFTGIRSEIEIGVKPVQNKLYLLDVSVRQAPNCSRCAYSITGPDGHGEAWDANGSEEHLY